MKITSEFVNIKGLIMLGFMDILVLISEVLEETIEMKNPNVYARSLVIRFCRNNSVFKSGYGYPVCVTISQRDESDKEICNLIIWLYRRGKNFLWEVKGEYESSPKEVAQRIADQVVAWMTVAEE